MTESFDIIAKTQFGLEEVLAEEIRAIGGKDVRIMTRAVRYTGDNEVLYKSNYHLRTALRILKPIETFRIFNDHQLLRKAKRIPWEKYFTLNDTFAVDAVTFGHIFRNSKYIALKTKDAIADRFREVQGRRPNVDVDDPTIRVNVHIADKDCTVSLDSSGHSLDKRGYKLDQTEASINEVLAAGIIAITGWNGQRPFVDPMCGSATFSTEAAMLAAQIAPGKGSRFAFEKWPDFDRSLWQQIKAEALSRECEPAHRIRASDVSSNAISTASSNIKRAGVEKFVDLTVEDFFKSAGASEGETVILNPPYGQRLGRDDDMITLYNNIGSHLKHFYPGASAWVLSGNLRALKRLGLRSSRSVKLFNGKIECRLCSYDLYHGSRKD